MIRSIAHEGRDLTNIVEDLLTAAKAEAGTLMVVSEPVDLRAEVSQVLDALGDGRRIELTGDSLRASGDPGRVRQILRNLISNAHRYGGDNIRICVIDSLLPRVQVRDNGVGIAMGDRERIFEPHQRALDEPGRDFVDGARVVHLPEPCRADGRRADLSLRAGRECLRAGAAVTPSNRNCRLTDRSHREAR